MKFFNFSFVIISRETGLQVPREYACANSFVFRNEREKITGEMFYTAVPFNEYIAYSGELFDGDYSFFSVSFNYPKHTQSTSANGCEIHAA